MKTISSTLLGISAAVAALATAVSANAVTTFSDLAAWQAAVGPNAETTNFGVADGTTIAGFTTTDGIPVTVAEQVHSIGDGWATWCCGYTGQVLADYLSLSSSYSLGAPVKGFGFFAEPDPFEVDGITLTLSDGTSLTEAVNGDSGASFFGWTGSGISGFTVSSSVDFATGDFFSAAAVPEPATWSLMFLGVGGVGAVFRSRKRVVVA